ncbi:MAG: hypothetical protein IPM27_10675 [Nitrosomonadales bacterium]|nr:hypothetical protein [Nitrosomonadales bacterium]
MAEFVAGLLDELGEATLAANRHQAERYDALRQLAGMDAAQFAARHLDEKDVVQYEADRFGAQLAASKPLTAAQLQEVRRLCGSEQGIVLKNSLSKAGLATVREKLALELVAGEQGLLNEQLARLEQGRITVDSGEIHARVALSLLEADAAPGGKSNASGINYLDDAEGGGRTILFERKLFGGAPGKSVDSPVRAVVTPLSQDAPATACTEIVIRFRNG